jgi:hypothetical protein
MPNPYDYSEPKKLISDARLSSYKNSLALKTDAEILGAYSWNLTLVGAFFPLLQLIEVALRNSLNEIAKSTIAVEEGKFWFQSIKHTQETNDSGQLVNPEQVKKFKEKFKSAKNGAKKSILDKGNNPDAVTLDQIVSQTDFSVWEYILDKSFYNGSDNSFIWPTQLPKAFKKLPRVNTKNPMFHQRDAIRRRIEEVRAFRNRISHNEPAWRVSDVSKPEEVIAYLIMKLDNMLELIYWISPKFRAYVHDVGIEDRIRQVLSMSEFNRYIHAFETYNIEGISDFVSLLEQTNTNNTRSYFQIEGRQGILSPCRTKLLQ